MKNLSLDIARNKRKLEELISKKADYQKILEQSQKLDKLINIEMKAQLEKNY